jgi:hypothetical protein
VQRLVRAITFQIRSDRPWPAPRDVQIVIRNGLGVASAALVKRVTVVPVNDPPQLTASGSTTLAFAKNAPALRLAANAIVFDPDQNLAGGRITAAFTGYYGISDQLALTGSDAAGIRVTAGKVYVDSQLVAQISGGGLGAKTLSVDLLSGATPSVVQRLVRALTYQNRSSSPATTPRDIKIDLRDGAGGVSAAIQRRIVWTA